MPPNNASEIDSSIKLIKEKIEFYNNPSEEDKAAFKEKSLKEWEERHVPRERKPQGNYKEKREQGNYKEKKEQGGYKEKRDDARDDKEEEAPKEKKEYQKKGKKAEIKEGDFPELA